MPWRLRLLLHRRPVQQVLLQRRLSWRQRLPGQRALRFRSVRRLGWRLPAPLLRPARRRAVRIRHCGRHWQAHALLWPGERRHHPPRVGLPRLGSVLRRHPRRPRFGDARPRRLLHLSQRGDARTSHGRDGGRLDEARHPHRGLPTRHVRRRLRRRVHARDPQLGRNQHGRGDPLPEQHGLQGHDLDVPGQPRSVREVVWQDEGHVPSSSSSRPVPVPQPSSSFVSELVSFTHCTHLRGRGANAHQQPDDGCHRRACQPDDGNGRRRL